MLAHDNVTSHLGHDSLPVCLCPWRENPHRLVSLWDMQQFSGEFLHGAIRMLDSMIYHWMAALPEGDAAIALAMGKGKMLTVDERKELEESLRFVESNIKGSGLPTSGEALMEFRTELINWKLPAFFRLAAKTVAERLEEIQRTIRREMKATVFMYVPSDRAQQFIHPLKEWDQVIERWTEVKGDIKESSMCLAFDRYSAALFHALLVAEFGVIQVGDFFGKSGDKPGWGCVERLQDVLAIPFKQRAALEKEHSKLLKDTVPQMMSLKADRHTLMHADNKRDWLVQQIGHGTATDAISTVRKFMGRIAKDLPKVP